MSPAPSRRAASRKRRRNKRGAGRGRRDRTGRAMLTAVVYGLAIGAVYAATALVYNVMFSTSKVLSVSTGHVPMLGGVFGAYFIAQLNLPLAVGLLGAIAVGAGFNLLTDIVAVRRVLARSD